MNSEKIKLINDAKDGNKLAIDKLIKSEQRNIYSTLLYMKKDDIDIMDITQNILIKLSSNIKKLNNPLSYRTWLNSIIINTYYDYLRKNKKHQDKNNDLNNENILEIPDKKFNPQDKVLQIEMDKIIKKSINNLPNHYKIPLALREIQGLSYNEISKVTKTEIGTVKSRISRARNLVQYEIEKYQNE